jgi:hypothetical protein
MAPICCMTPMRSNCAQCSAILPSTTRLMSTPGIFPNADGGPLDYSNWRRRVWLPAAAATGLKGVGFHDLDGGATERPRTRRRGHRSDP